MAEQINEMWMILSPSSGGFVDQEQPFYSKEIIDEAMNLVNPNHQNCLQGSELNPHSITEDTEHINRRRHGRMSSGITRNANLK